jgi:RNA polymerase-binding transcription factor DksA
MAKKTKPAAKKSSPKKTAVKKPPAAKKPASKKSKAKPPLSKKTVAKKPTKGKSAAKKTVTKKVAAKSAVKKSAPAPIKAKPARAATPSRTKPVAPAPAVPATVKATDKPAKPSSTMEKPSKKNALRNSILKRKPPAKPIAFSLDEVRAIAQTVASKSADTEKAPKTPKPAAAKAAALTLERPAKPNLVKPASLADILGFNPKKARPADPEDGRDVPEKYKRFYKLLIDLRRHLTKGIELHSEETLKRSSKDDSGDLSSYGQHMADAGTDTFDRDFALSLVSSEQEALSEIDAAIKRVHSGTYGICEITQKPIAKERLLAVPFTRYSAEAQKELEKNRYRTRTAGGLFGELGEEGGKIMDEDSDE